MSRADDSGAAIARAAQLVRGTFAAYLAEFNDITARAPERFTRRDWRGGQTDAIERLDLYSLRIESLLAGLRIVLGERMDERGTWIRIKRVYARAISGDPNVELLQSFYNSATRWIFSTQGVDPESEFVTADTAEPGAPAKRAALRQHAWTAHPAEVLARILASHRFAIGWRDAAGDARAAARQIARQIEELGAPPPQTVETLAPLFFRNKGAYVIGRLLCGTRTLPFVIPLLSSPDGVHVDAVLLDEDEVSILFSFTRSYFHVEAERPAELIEFLRTILPRKPVAELYISLGFHKHGKTQLYRDLRRQLDASPERFVAAPGDRGLVMLVFTLPSHDRVYKVIRDIFAYPKRTSARAVIERYRLVFERDRVGRLVEAQEFEHLRFDRRRFSDALLEELLQGAAGTVSERDGDILIERLYTERKVRPLNLYVEEVELREARRAIVDYGNAIRELAAANIFPGDFLLKNFGVTRHGRVVFYDYDELCLLTDCNFRRMPPARTPEDELSDEPWFQVGDDDVFPEEFRTFLDLRDPLFETFESWHGELFQVEFWQRLKERHLAGELLDFYPYPQRRRLSPGAAG